MTGADVTPAFRKSFQFLTLTYSSCFEHTNRFRANLNSYHRVCLTGYTLKLCQLKGAPTNRRYATHVPLRNASSLKFYSSLSLYTLNIACPTWTLLFSRTQNSTLPFGASNTRMTVLPRLNPPISSPACSACPRRSVDELV
jgi:hypothetical protein